MEPRYHCLYMMLRNERFKHPHPKNVEKEWIFWGPSKNQSSIPLLCFYINPFLLKSEGILDSYDLDLWLATCTNCIEL